MEVLNLQLLLLYLILQGNVLLDELLVPLRVLEHVLVELVHSLLHERLVLAAAGRFRELCGSPALPLQLLLQVLDLNLEARVLVNLLVQLMLHFLFLVDVGLHLLEEPIEFFLLLIHVLLRHFSELVELLVPFLELLLVLSVGFLAIYLQLFDGDHQGLDLRGLVLDHLALLAEFRERAVDLRGLLADLIVELLDHRLLLVNDVGDLADLFFLLGAEVLLLLLLLVLEVAELLIELLEPLSNLL